MNLALRMIGRFLYAVPLIIFGINHFIYTQSKIGSVPDYMPLQIFWVYFTGIALIAAGVSIITNIHAYVAGLLLALMLILFVIMIHLPGVLIPENMHASMTPFLKDTALAGGAIFIAGHSKKH